MGRPWVLVTDGGRGAARDRDALVAVRALARGGYRPAVTVSDGPSLAAASRHCARTVVVPPLPLREYAQAIREETAENDYLTVVPASEAALIAIAPPVVPHLLDKEALADAAISAGFAVPPHQVFPSARSLLAAAANLEYPLVVKPTVRRYNAFRADSPLTLAAGITDNGPVLTQPYLSAPQTAVAGVLWQGRLVAAVHERWIRIFPIDCGLPSAAETVPPDTDREERLLMLLSGYEGLFYAQFAGDALFDLNLRIHSSHPLAVRAGVNLLAIYCDLLRGGKPEIRRAQPGALYRWLEGDLRNLIGTVREQPTDLAAAAARMRPRRGTAHGVESLRDPRPLLVRLAHAAGTAAHRSREANSSSG